MPRAARIIDNFRRLIRNNSFERQTVPNESRYRQRRKKLSFVLLKALVKQLFKQIAERLQISRADNPIVAEYVDDFFEDFGVEVEKFIVVHVDESKSVVRVKLELAEILFKVANLIAVILRVAEVFKDFIGIIFRQIKNIFAHEFFHAVGIEALQSVLKNFVGIRAALELELNFAAIGR